MRILVISDIHANLTALEAVLADAGVVEAAWCLGDIVGYGPDPNECVERIRQLPKLKCIIGNHDAAVLRQIDVSTFNHEARQAVQWTRSVITADNLDFLGSLPERLEPGRVTLAHGSPRHPVWEYLMDKRNATQNFEHFTTEFCFVGHTHIPLIFSLPEDASSAEVILPQPNSETMLIPRAIVNPGSVGQPRDRDPRAAYAVFDDETAAWEYRRIAYDIPAVQARMYAANLPERHALRLTGGW